LWLPHAVGHIANTVASAATTVAALFTITPKVSAGWSVSSTELPVRKLLTRNRLLC
jgi:hypothetical protein